MDKAKKQPDSILYYGDNLDILKRYIKDESVDLIYLDPPFKSNQDYNVLFPEQNGSRSRAQLKAFEDTWEWNQEESAPAYQKIVETGPEKVSKAMQAFRTFLGASDMMAPRLVEQRRVLKPTKAMRTEAASAGFYKSHWGSYPRLQILTIADLMGGKRIDFPPSGDVRTFKKAPNQRISPRNLRLLTCPYCKGRPNALSSRKRNIQ